MLTIKTPERRQWRRYDVWLICTYGKTRVQIIPPDDELKLRKNIVYDILRFFRENRHVLTFVHVFLVHSCFTMSVSQFFLSSK